MHQHQAGMDEIERAFLQRLGRDVVSTDLQVRPVCVVEEAGIDVGGDDVAGGSDAVAEPGGDATAAGTHLQAVPALGDAELRQVTDRSGIEQRPEG